MSNRSVTAPSTECTLRTTTEQRGGRKEDRGGGKWDDREGRRKQAIQNVATPPFIYQKFGAMHFIYQINRLTTTKVDSTYLGSLANNAQRIICPVAGLERMTTGSAVSALPYLATRVDRDNNALIHLTSTRQQPITSLSSQHSLTMD